MIETSEASEDLRQRERRDKRIRRSKRIPRLPRIVTRSRFMSHRATALKAVEGKKIKTLISAGRSRSTVKSLDVHGAMRSRKSERDGNRTRFYDITERF